MPLSRPTKRAPSIPVPNWRHYTLPSLSSNSVPPAPLYLSLQHSAALVERSSWAPPSASKSSTQRKVRPWFPTPAEAQAIIDKARVDAMGGDMEKALAAMARVKKVVKEEMGNVKTIDAGDAVKAVVTVLEDLQKRIDEGGEELGVGRGEDLEEMLTTRCKYSNEGEGSLSECIRRRIDAEKYPVLKKRFVLHDEYMLDGTGDSPMLWGGAGVVHHSSRNSKRRKTRRDTPEKAEITEVAKHRNNSADQPRIKREKEVPGNPFGGARATRIYETPSSPGIITGVKEGGVEKKRSVKRERRSFKLEGHNERGGLKDDVHKVVITKDTGSSCQNRDLRRIIGIDIGRGIGSNGRSIPIVELDDSD